MINPKTVYILKNLALLGAKDDFKSITTVELGRIIGMSQQSTSRWLQKLKMMGLIDVNKIENRMNIKITKEGMDILKKESFDYRRIFESPKYIELTGEVITGLGEGRYYITKRGYYNQIKEKLFFEPYPGTLNIKVYPRDLDKVEILKNMPGILIRGFESKGRSYGNVKAYLCTINGVEASLVIPERTHYDDVIEIISNKNLRKKLKLRDGDPVDIIVFL